jgi:hypothetical protein
LLTAELLSTPIVHSEILKVQSIRKDPPTGFGDDTLDPGTARLSAPDADEEDPGRLTRAPESPLAESSIHREMDADDDWHTAQPAEVLANGIDILLVAVNQLNAVSFD